MVVQPPDLLSEQPFRTGTGNTELGKKCDPGQNDLRRRAHFCTQSSRDGADDYTRFRKLFLPVPSHGFAGETAGPHYLPACICTGTRPENTEAWRRL